MIKKIQYQNETDKQSIILQYQNLYLIGEENLFSGNFLIFSETLPEKEIIYTQIPQEEYENLKSQLALTQEALDTIIMGGM